MGSCRTKLTRMTTNIAPFLPSQCPSSVFTDSSWRRRLWMGAGPKHDVVSGAACPTGFHSGLRWLLNIARLRWCMCCLHGFGDAVWKNINSHFVTYCNDLPSRWGQRGAWSHLGSGVCACMRRMCVSLATAGQHEAPMLLEHASYPGPTHAVLPLLNSKLLFDNMFNR